MPMIDVYAAADLFPLGTDRTPPGVLSRVGQKQLVSDATSIVAEVCGDPTQARRT